MEVLDLPPGAVEHRARGAVRNDVEAEESRGRDGVAVRGAHHGRPEHDLCAEGVRFYIDHHRQSLRKRPIDHKQSVRIGQKSQAKGGLLVRFREL